MQIDPNQNPNPANQASASERVQSASSDPTPGPALNTAYWAAWTAINTLVCADSSNPNIASPLQGLIGIPGTSVTGGPNAQNITILSAPHFTLLQAAGAIDQFKEAYEANPVGGTYQQIYNLIMQGSPSLSQTAANIVNKGQDPQTLITDEGEGQGLGQLATLLHNTGGSTNPTDKNQYFMGDLSNLQSDLLGLQNGTKTIADVRNDFIKFIPDVQSCAGQDGIASLMANILTYGDVGGTGNSIQGLVSENPPDDQGLQQLITDNHLYQIFANLNTVAQAYEQ